MMKKRVRLNSIDILEKLGHRNMFLCPSFSYMKIHGTYNQNEGHGAIYASDIMVQQSALLLKSKVSIAGFSLKKGTYISIKVTLRNNQLNNFLNIYSEFNHIHNHQFHQNTIHGALQRLDKLPYFSYQYLHGIQIPNGFNITLYVTNSKCKTDAKLLLSAYIS